MSQNCESNLGHHVPDSIVPEEDSKPNLLTLPDLPLLLVLQNSSLQALIIDLPLVDPRFAPLCDLVLKQNLKQNHRLLLYIGDLESIQEFKCLFRIGIPFVNYLADSTNGKHPNDPEFYRLHYATFDAETVDKLVTLMPAISHLEIVISQVNICLISRLIRLLNHWASTLKELKVCSAELQRENSQHFFTLISEINLKLSVLEHLTLDLDGELFVDPNFGNEVAQESLELPILGQLKEFFFQSRDKLYFSKLFDTLHRQAGEQLTEIGFGQPFTWEHNPINLLNHPLAARLTLLSTRYEPPFELTSLPNLQGFTAHWHLNQPLNSCTRKLVSLRQLQYLELRRLSHNGSVSVDPAELSSLPSVEILRIHFNNCFEFANQDHTVLQDDAWASLFPSVQIVNLIHLGDFCAKCYPEDGNCGDKSPGFEQTKERTACLSQLLAPLTVLPSLRKIFYQRNEDLKNIAEFTRKGVFVKTHAYIY